MSHDFTDAMDLASLRLGGAVIATSDDYFAEMENLLKPGDAVFLPHEYTARGKWMDGWESRRKRVVGHDWAIIRLGVPGVLRGAVVDTAFFRGNFPSHCSLDACALPTDAGVDALLADDVEWVEVLPRSPLQGDSKNLFAIDCEFAFTHVRLNIFPDGGVARLRLFGDAVPDWRRIGHARGEIDVAAAEHGGHVLTCSDMFFGERRNLIMPDRALNMSDGWETRRRRGPGHDWAIVRLGARATISRLLIDTNHFKGNYPDTCTVEACDAPGASVESLTHGDHPWRPLLGRTKLHAHTRHLFEDELHALGPVTHVRLNVFPDGGVSRLRVFGSLDASAKAALGVRRLNTLLPRAAEAALLQCCGATRWARAMLHARPFASADAVAAAADAHWAACGEDDWLEAFRAHPRIGERKAHTDTGAEASRWSAQEQAGMDRSDASLKAALAEVNAAYEAKYGFIYIVCATGMSPEALLDYARRRMDSTREAELRTAAAEQHKILRLRLEKLLKP